MRKLLLAAATLCCMAFTQTEKYYVTFIKGSVTVQGTGKAVKVGDALNPADKLLFKDAGAKLSCISPGKGRFDINAGGAKAHAGGELLAVLKDALVPLASSHRFSTRSNALEEYDPKIYFRAAETGDRVLLIKDEPFPVLSTYPADDSHYFFIQYQLADKAVTRKVKQVGNGLLFTDELFKDLPSSAGRKIRLCYQTSSGDNPRHAVLASFIPVLASKAEVQEQIRVIKAMSGSTDPKKLNNEIMAHVYENFGKIGSEELLKLME